MISIKYQGLPLDLGKISLTFRLRSPLWNEVPSHTFSFDIDNNDHNRAILGHLHRPSNAINTGKAFAVQADVHGWKLGATMRLQSATEKVLRFFMAIDNGQLNVDWGDDYIDEMQFPEVTRSGGVSQLMVYNLDKTSDEVACQFPPIRIPEYFGSEDPDDALLFMKWVNYYDPEMGGYLAPFVEPSAGKVYQYTVAVPQFYLRWVIAQIASKNGVKLNSNFMGSELNELLVFNNRNVNTKKRTAYFRASKTSAQTFASQQTLVFNNESTFPNEDPDGCYNTSNGLITVKNYGIHEFVVSVNVTAGAGEYKYMIINDQAYNIYYGENLIKYTTFFGVGAIGSTLKCEIYSYDIDGDTEIPRDITIAAGAYVVGRNASFSELATLYTDGSITPSEHLPHVKVKELFGWLKDGFAACPVFDASARELRFVFLKDVLTRPASRELGDLGDDTEYSPEQLQGLSYHFDISSDDAPVVASIAGFDYMGEFTHYGLLPMPDNNNKAAYVTTEGKFYVYTWNDTSSRYEWQLFSDYLSDYTPSTAELDIAPKWHPPANFYEGDIFGHTPMVGCKGSSPYFKVGVNRPPLLLMFYHGMQPALVTDGGTTLYFPLANGLSLDAYATPINNLELRWEGTNGLRQTFWLPVEQFYAERGKLEGRKEIDALWLKQLVWDEAYLHRGRQYLLDSVEFTATQLGFTNAQITAWRKP